MGLKSFFKRWRSTSVTVDYSSWDDDQLRDLWRGRGQLTSDALATLKAELLSRGIEPGAKPSLEPSARAGVEPGAGADVRGDRDPGALPDEASEPETYEEALAEEGLEEERLAEAAKFELVKVTSGWSLALWAGNDEYVIVALPPKDGATPATLAAPPLGEDERVSAVVVVDPLDSGWSPSAEELSAVGVGPADVYRLGEAKAARELVGKHLKQQVNLGRLLLRPLRARHSDAMALRVRWLDGVDGALLIGQRLTAELVGIEPHASHLVGGLAPLDEWGGDRDTAKLAAALATTTEALVLAGARDVDAEEARRFLPQLGVSATVVGMPSGARADSGPAADVQQAALADDWEKVGELLPGLEQGDFEELFEANAIDERYDLMERIGAAACERDPDHGLAWFLRGAVATMQGDEDTALAHYRRSIATSRPEPRAWANLAAVQAEAGDLDGALRTVERGHAELPGDEIIATTHVIILRNRGETAAARAALAEHGAAIGERNRENLGRMLDTPYVKPTGPPTRRWPHLANRAAQAAAALARDGQLDEAERVYRRAWALDSSQEALLYALGDIGPAMVDAGLVGRALALYDECLADYPNMAPIRFNRANALLQQGRAPEAVAELRRCIEIVPEWGDPRVNLVITLTALGEFDAAEAELDVLEQAGVDMDLVMALDDELEAAREAAGLGEDG